MASDVFRSPQARFRYWSRSPGGPDVSQEEALEKAKREKEAIERKERRMEESKQLRLFGLCPPCCDLINLSISSQIDPMQPTVQFDHFRSRVSRLNSACCLCIFVNGLPIEREYTQGRARVQFIYTLGPNFAGYTPSNSRALLTFQLRNQTEYERWRNKETPYVAAGTFGLLHSSFSFDDIRPRRVDPTFIDFSIIKEWLQFCKTHHADTCDSTTGDQVKGLKLIDCKTRAVLNAGTTSRYVALSYVWGPVQMTGKDEGVFLQLSKTVCWWPSSWATDTCGWINT
jgi:hypothetical protein